MLNVLYLQISIVLLIIVGIVLKKIKIISEQGKKELTNLVIYLILPCNILKAFMVDFQAGMGADFVKIVIISIVIQLFSLIYGRVWMKRLLKHFCLVISRQRNYVLKKCQFLRDLQMKSKWSKWHHER